MDERFGVGMYAAHGTKFVGECSDPYASWKGFVSLFSVYKNNWLIVIIIDWRRPPYPVYTADYATYVQILTWFLDTPVQEAPFSVHRMALAGKELGTDVGQWFGPSVAAGAIKYVFLSFSPLSSNISLFSL